MFLDIDVYVGGLALYLYYSCFVLLNFGGEVVFWMFT